MTDMTRLLREIELELEEIVAWADVPDDRLAAHGARAKKGAGPNWEILIVEFPREGGWRDVDGSATHLAEGLIVHLTRELAQRAKEKAWP